MGYARELADPWGLLLAASSAGVAWAIHLPVAATVGVGVVVLAARALVGGLTRGDEEPNTSTATKITVDPGTPEATWFTRATAAESDFDAIAGSLVAGPLAEQVSGMADGINETVRTLHRLAGRATMTGRATARVDSTTLERDERRLTKVRETADPDLHEELDRSLESVRAQLDVHRRLSSAHGKLLAQLESGALGLEGLVARVVELSTTADQFPEDDNDLITALADQLEGIRAGVAETEATTRRTVG
ncbi:hypothetical protein [Actinokineospora sp. NBRC 105648]|uniref:hypothetical protein n=1 Tax=Actinokineospora sp. NBRC 105648 TaxID=3032206 RepID=UPI002554531C|nr:hypothetical protein [Actinokineospora sp. NBRC 105648]